MSTLFTERDVEVGRRRRGGGACRRGGIAYSQKLGMRLLVAVLVGKVSLCCYLSVGIAALC